MRHFICLIILCVGFLGVMVIFAQDTECATLVQTALQGTDEQCNTLGRNQICYGNTQISTTLVENVSDVSFEMPGDIVDATVIENLQLSVLQEPDIWGIAIMKIQANLPDTVPGQNVTILLFGDVFIENLASESDDNDLYGAMQAFVFRTGIGELACEEAPPDGILIQTPSGSRNGQP